jgi:N-acetylglucosamine-6-phosphate deacetylase
MGHSDATYKKALDGKKAGARGITHIFNTMRPFHHREPGLIGLGLLDEDLYIEVIADRVHIDEVTLKVIFQVKRLDRIILVSDSVKGKKDRKGRIYAKPGVLAGSSITLADAVENIKKIGVTEAIALETAIDNPRRYLVMK